MGTLDYGNSKVKDGTATVELYIHEKSMGDDPRPCYSPQAPLQTPPLLSSTLLLAQHAQKGHTKVEGREGGMLTKLICCFEHYNGIILYFITDVNLL